MPPLARTRSAGRDARRPRPAGRPRPTRRRATEVAVDDDASCRRVAERRHPADGEAGRGARLVAVGASDARRAGRRPRACRGRPGSAPETRATTGRSSAMNTSDFTICATSQPTARAASAAVRVPSGKRSNLDLEAAAPRPPRRRGHIRVHRPILGCRARLAAQPKRRQGSATALRVRRRDVADPRT